MSQDSTKNVPVAVIVPALDEHRTIGTVIQKVRASLPEGTVVVVDGGSSDDTAERARIADAKIVIEKRRGYGRAIRTEIESVNAEFYIILDADDTYEVSVIRQMLERAKQGKVVVGKRSPEKNGMTISHRIGNGLLAIVYRFMYNQGIRDTQSGFKIFPNRIAKNLREDGMTLSTEIVLVAHRLGFDVDEVSVSYHPRHSKSQSKFFFWKDGIPVLLFLVSGRISKYRPSTFDFVGGVLRNDMRATGRLRLPEQTEGQPLA